MITETISIRLDPQQVEEITREVQRQAFRCGACQHGTRVGGPYPEWLFCKKLALAQLTITDQGTVPMPMPTVHQDFGCNRFEEVTPHDQTPTQAR